MNNRFDFHRNNSGNIKLNSFKYTNHRLQP